MQVVSGLVTLVALILACGSAASSHNDFWGLSLSGSGEATFVDDAEDGAFASEALFLHGTFVCATCFMLMVRRRRLRHGPTELLVMAAVLKSDCQFAMRMHAHTTRTV
jgi:hypothetical protein